MLEIMARQKYLMGSGDSGSWPEQVPFTLLRREWDGKMLQPGEVIDADIARDGRILLAIGADVNQSRRTSPIFVGGVGEKNLGHDFVSGGAVEQPTSLSGDWIFLRLIREGKDIGGKENRRSGPRVARRLGEPVVEAAPARSRDVGENSVERDSSVFVRIEALIEKVAQKAPVLRDAFAVDPLSRSDGIGIVLGIGSKVAYGSEAAAGHDRVGDHINVFVNLPWLEAAVQVDVPVAGKSLPSTV